MPSFSRPKGFFRRILKRDNEVPFFSPPTNVSDTSLSPRAAQLIVPEISPQIIQPPSDGLPSRLPGTGNSSTDALPGDSNDLWARAFALAKQREEELMGDYERHIFSLDDIFTDSKGFSGTKAVEAHVKRLLEIRQKNKIHVSILGHNVVVSEQIEKLAKFLVWSDSIVKTAVSAQPFAALAWSGVSLFLPLLISGTKYNDGMLTGFNSVNDMQVFWKACEDTYFTSSDLEFYQSLKGPLVKLYSFIVEYQARVICHLSKAQLSRAWQTVTGSDDWAETIKPIQDQHEKCLCLVDKVHKDIIQDKMDNQLQEIQRSRIIQEEILQAMKEDREEEKERSLLSDLASASGDYERYKNINPERVPGTCMWFLADERFHNWRASKSGDMLWVSAGPGCGKSVLSRSLIDERHLNPETTVTISSSEISVSEGIVCYFFFKDGGEGRMDGAHALCAILHQLFSRGPQFIECALSSHKMHGQDLTRRTDELWRILVDCANTSPVPIICLLDALDECKEEGRTRLITKLQDLYRHTSSSIPSKLKFLITSRPYETIRMSFDRLTETSAYLHFDGDDKSGQIGQEINLVIDVKVGHITGSFSAQDRNKISQRLKAMDNRTYLWLHLTVEIIERNLSAYSRRLDMEEFLSTLPSTVSDAYEKILSRSQDDRKVEALLQIVLAAERPLTLDEANYALTLALGDEFSSHEELQEHLWPQDRFRTTPGNLCGLFISIHDSKLSFIHQTAREFLLHQERKGMWKGRLSKSTAHELLSGACMNYLLLCDAPSENYGPMKRDSLFSSYTLFRAKDEFMKKYPFFFYASESWHSQFKQGAGPTVKHRKLARSLCRVSAPQTKNWATYSSPLIFLSRKWHIWSDFLLAVHYDLATVVRDMMALEDPDVNGVRVKNNDTPLLMAIRRHSLEVMKVLLKPDSGVFITSNNVFEALRQKSAAALALLLDKRGEEIKITKDVLNEAVKNFHGGAVIMALLLDKRPEDVKVTQALLKTTISYGSAETLSLLLDGRGSEVEITEDIILATISTNNGTTMLSLLLKKRAHDIKITESLVAAAMEKAYPDWVLILLNKRIHGIEITQSVAKTAVLLARDVRIATLLLDDNDDEFEITQDVIKAAINRYRGSEMTALLLDKRGHEFSITEDIVWAAVNSSNALENMTLLLERRGHEFKITEDMVEAAARHIVDGSSLITLFLDKRGHEFKITQEIVEAASSNKWMGRETVSILEERRRRETNVAEDRK